MRRFFLSFGLCLVLLLPGASHAEEVQPQPINPECTLTASRGTVSANKLYDDSRKSSIRFTADRMLTVCCDSGSTIGAVYLQFVHIPSAPFYTGVLGVLVLLDQFVFHLFF